jgi:hypothetical protein
MQLSEIGVRTAGDCCELRARVRCDTDWVNGGQPFWLWYRFPRMLEPFLDVNNGDPFLAALLGPAMVVGEALEISAPVSASLLHASSQIQTIYHCWDPALSRVRVVAPVRDEKPAAGSVRPRNALFFSLGMDSFYTLLKNTRDHPQDEETITDLVVLHGFDIFVDKWNTNVFDAVRERSARVAGELGKCLVPVAMNIRELSDQLVDWEELYHGAAMASVALALQPFFRRAYIAATYTYDRLFPCGSHPLLDPLWSTRSLTFVHDGLEASRPEKGGFLGRFPIAMETLRVCFENPDDQYNCGRCEKCVRSMLCLHLGGALERCQTLPQTLDPELVRSTVIPNRSTRTLYRRLAAALGTTAADERLRVALHECLTRAAV